MVVAGNGSKYFNNNQKNSYELVFTAEALVIHLAFVSLPSLHKNIIILSDSLSTIRALENWSMKSPKVLLLSDICRVTQRGHSITLVWCPGRKDIPSNEAADLLASSGPYFCFSLPWISPEDALSIIYKDWSIELDYAWASASADYASRFPHLHPDCPIRSQRLLSRK